MNTEAARARLNELYAKCYPVAGKPGGLLDDEAAEFQRLADSLGLKVEWRRFELLKTLDWVDHPSEANYQTWLAERRAGEASSDD